MKKTYLSCAAVELRKCYSNCFDTIGCVVVAEIRKSTSLLCLLVLLCFLELC
jgi:hypothetical protein